MSSPRSIGRTATSPANAKHHGWGKQTQNNSKPYFTLLVSMSWSSLWRERGPFEGIDCWFAVSSTLACGYCKCSIFRRQGHLFPLAGGQQDPELYCSLSQTVHLLVPLVVIGERLLLQSILKQQRNWPGGSCSHNMACHFYWMETVKNRKEMIGDWDKDGMESGWIQNEWKFRLNINSHL